MFLLLFFFSYFFTISEQLCAAQYPRLLRRNAIISRSTSEGVVPRQKTPRQTPNDREIPTDFEGKLLKEMSKERKARAQEAKNLTEHEVPSDSQ